MPRTKIITSELFAGNTLLDAINAPCIDCGTPGCGGECWQERRDRENRRFIAMLLRLGGMHERLQQARDFERLVLVDENIQAIAAELIAREYSVPEMLVIRGRNCIRKARGQELIHL